MWWGLLVAVVVAVLAGASPPARAHEFGPDIRVRLDEVPAVLDDVTIEIVTSIAPQLAVGNPTDDPLEILTLDGVPFLRIGPDGAEANLDSADFYLTQDPLGALAVPERARGDGTPPTWARIAAAPEWAWFDHRMHPQNVAQLREPVSTPEGTVLATFVVPVRYRGETVEVRGSIVQQAQVGRLEGELRAVPEIDGVSIQLLEGGTPGLFLEADDEREVVVLGRAGEPFLRFSGGVVEANVRSPSWYDSGRATRVVDGEAPVLDPAAEPQWFQVNRGPRFGWIETRGLYQRGTADEDLQLAGVDRDLVDWSVPILVDGERFEIVGVTRFLVLDEFRDEGASGAALWVPIGIAVVGIVVGGTVLARRRR